MSCVRWMESGNFLLYRQGCRLRSELHRPPETFWVAASGQHRPTQRQTARLGSCQTGNVVHTRLRLRQRPTNEETGDRDATIASGAGRRPMVEAFGGPGSCCYWGWRAAAFILGCRTRELAQGTFSAVRHYVHACGHKGQTKERRYDSTRPGPLRVHKSSG